MICGCQRDWQIKTGKECVELATPYVVTPDKLSPGKLGQTTRRFIAINFFLQSAALTKLYSKFVANAKFKFYVMLQNITTCNGILCNTRV